MQYSNFKDTLQNIASQIGNVEQEVEEHKYVLLLFCFQGSYTSLAALVPIEFVSCVNSRMFPLGEKRFLSPPPLSLTFGSRHNRQDTYGYSPLW